VGGKDDKWGWGWERDLPVGRTTPHPLVTPRGAGKPEVLGGKKKTIVTETRQISPDPYPLFVSRGKRISWRLRGEGPGLATRIKTKGPNQKRGRLGKPRPHPGGKTSEKNVTMAAARARSQQMVNKGGKESLLPGGDRPGKQAAAKKTFSNGWGVKCIRTSVDGGDPGNKRETTIPK